MRILDALILQYRQQVREYLLSERLQPTTRSNLKTRKTRAGFREEELCGVMPLVKAEQLRGRAMRRWNVYKVA